jgi:hypothetical protein
MSDPVMADPATKDTAPRLRVVGGGEPTPQELAALVVALASRAATTQASPARSAWADRAALMRRPHRHGRDVWRHSG